MANPKMFQKGAFKLESNSSDGWGGDKATFGANDGFPWITFDNSLGTETAENESVLDRAFKSNPRKVKELPENPLSAYVYFSQLRNFLYWCLGYENDPNEVVVVKVATSTDPCSSSEVGEVFSDGTNDFLYVRSEKQSSSMYQIIFEPSSSSQVPDGSTMTGADNADEISSGDIDSISDTMYEHILELDSRGRQMRTLSSSEYNSLDDFGSTDKKTLQATLCKKMENYDLLYKNAMSKSFSLSASPGGLMQINSDFVAYNEERVALSRPSDTYDLISALATLDNVIAHYQCKFELGETESGLTELGIGEFNLNAENPLNMEQSTLSGYSVDSPILSAPYNVSLSATIQRHSAQTWQTIRDNWTSVVGKLSAWYGFKLFKVVIEEGKINTAGPDNSDVAKEPLELNAGYVSASNWTDWSAGQSGSIDPSQRSPLKVVIRDTDNTNSMNVDIV